MTSYWRRCDVTMSHRRPVPTRFFHKSVPNNYTSHLKSDNIENSRIELKGIVLQVPSDQIKVSFLIILPFNLVQLWVYPVSHRNWRKMWVDYWGGGGGAKGMLVPLSNYLGRGLAPLPPPPPPLPPPLPTSMVLLVSGFKLSLFH